MRLLALLVLLCFPITAFAKSNEKPKNKRIAIYLLSQTLLCYQNGEEVYRTRICSGKGWGAPNSKKKMKYRPLYHVLRKDPRGEKADSKVLVGYKKVKGEKVPIYKNAKTPNKLILSWDFGHYVRIHGYHSLPRRPSSHGCFREGIKASKWVYDFAEVGMPVEVHPGKAPKKSKKEKPPSLKDLLKDIPPLPSGEFFINKTAPSSM